MRALPIALAALLLSVVSGHAGAAPAPVAVKNKYWSVWVDQKGMSHQQQCEFHNYVLQPVRPGVAPEFMDSSVGTAYKVIMFQQPIGWNGVWHTNPKPQWVITLSGHWGVETQDGRKVVTGLGEISFGGDQLSAPDAQGRVGHSSSTVGDEPVSLAIVQVMKCRQGACPASCSNLISGK